MRLKEIYELAIQMGMEHDPRGREAVKALLAENRKNYEEMKEEDKQFYDLEQLENPYSDTRVLHGSMDLEVKRVLAGIDIEVG